jgi:hypothetical protein
MTKTAIQKNMKLGLEFDSYVSKNPAILKKVPKGSSVLVLDSNSKVVKNSVLGRFVIARKSGRSWEIEKDLK